MTLATAARRPSLMLPAAARSVWLRHFDVGKHLWLSNAIMPIVEPLLTFLVLGFGLGQFVELENGRDYIEFIAPGMLAAFPMWQALFSCTWPAFLRMDSQQVHQAMMATPLEPEDIGAGEIAWGATVAALSTFYVLLMSLAFGTVDSGFAALVVPIGFIHGAMIGSMALAYTATITNGNALNYFFTVVALPMFWFGDVFVPQQTLPDAFQVIGWFVPTTHTVAVYRDLLHGNLGLDTLGHLVWVVVVGAAFFALAMRQMRRRLVQ